MHTNHCPHTTTYLHFYHHSHTTCCFQASIFCKKNTPSRPKAPAAATRPAPQPQPRPGPTAPQHPPGHPVHARPDTWATAALHHPPAPQTSQDSKLNKGGSSNFQHLARQQPQQHPAALNAQMSGGTTTHGDDRHRHWHAPPKHEQQQRRQLGSHAGASTGLERETLAQWTSIQRSLTGARPSSSAAAQAQAAAVPGCDDDALERDGNGMDSAMSSARDEYRQLMESQQQQQRRGPGPRELAGKRS